MNTAFFLHVLAALVAIFLEVTQDRCNKILQKFVIQCTDVRYLYTFTIFYIYVHLPGFVTISNCSMYGRGLFKSQASIQIRIPLKICQHLLAKLVCMCVYVYICMYVCIYRYIYIYIGKGRVP